MKTADHITTLSYMPFKLFLYGKALTKRDHTAADKVTGKIAFSVHEHKIDIGNLNRYRNSCGFINNGLIPVTYPFVIGFPLIMKILTASQFPVAVLGLVHYKNQITQYAPIAETASLSLICSVSDDQDTPLGRVFDIRLELYAAGQLVWESISSFFKKNTKRKTRSTTKATFHDLQLQRRATFTLTPFIALKYAFISGDLNPIHMHKFAARLFGFNRSIIHGMWSKARAIAALEEDMQHLPTQIEVQFEKPILLPAKIQLNYRRSASAAQFSLTDPTQKISHLTGTVRHLN